MTSLATERLKNERKNWRKDHPVGFWAKCATTPDGSVDLFRWEAGIPGKKGSPWEGGEYRVQIEFPKEYPMKPPKCRFVPVIFHPNVFPSGTVCLSILNEEKGWQQSISVKEILLGLQNLLDDPNPNDPAAKEPYDLYRINKKAYEERVRREAASRKPAAISGED
jgi:ubiquitin-conjugating enzyme E2 I